MSKEYVGNIVDRFQAAWAIVHEKDRLPKDPTQWREHAKLILTKGDSAPEGFWKTWPKEPTAFELHHRAGNSALQAATLFTSDVERLLAYSAVQLGMFYPQALKSDSLTEWRQAFAKNWNELNEENISAARSFQARDLLIWKIDLEWASFEKLQPESKPKAKRSRVQPDREITWAMLGGKS